MIQPIHLNEHAIIYMSIYIYIFDIHKYMIVIKKY